MIAASASTTKLLGLARGEGGLENKDSQKQILKIKLGSGGVLISDGDAGLKSYTSIMFIIYISLSG